MRRSLSSISISTSSSSSGQTKTDAKEVWRARPGRTARCARGGARRPRPRGGRRRTRPGTMSVALLMPASSPGWKSMISRLKPRRSAQRRYMRSSISAQSCDSVPPAPGLMVTMAFVRSCSPPSIFLISAASTSPPARRGRRVRSAATSSPDSSHSARTSGRPPGRGALQQLEVVSRRRRRCSTFWAAAWSFQKPGAAIFRSRASALGRELVLLKDSRGCPRPSLAATRTAASGLRSRSSPPVHSS